MATDVTDATFQSAVIERSSEHPVIVDLWAPWCGPCRTLGPILEKVVDESDGAVELVKVNVDENPQVSAAFQVQSIPAVFALSGRQVVDGFIGAVPEPQVRDFVGRLAQAPSPADQLVEAGDEASLRQALELEPGHHDAIVTLAELLVARGDTREALALLARVPETAETRRVAALARLGVAGKDEVLADDGLDERFAALLERVKDDDEARQEYVDLLEAMDTEDERRSALPPSALLTPVLSTQLAVPLSCSLGERHYDLSRHVLVMGIVNRTPDSFFDHGRHFELDRSLRLADALVTGGADIIDVGGVRAGPGPEVAPAEEVDRVVPAIEAIASRFDVALSVDTWNAEVADAAFSAGAVLGNDISGFADPDYLSVAARHGTSVVATHIRLRPRVDDPDPAYPGGDVVAAVEAYLVERIDQAAAAGIPADRLMIDAGLDLGKTTAQSLELLGASARRLARLGPALLLSASNKGFLGELLDRPVEERQDATVAALALGILLGCRVVRVHDAEAARRTAGTIEAVLTP